MNSGDRRKIIAFVAPVGTNILLPSMNPLTPPEEVAQEVIAFAEAAASMGHFHVRDWQGNQTEKLTEFSKLLR